MLRTSCSGLAAQATPKARLTKQQNFFLHVKATNGNVRGFCHVLCARTSAIRSFLTHWRNSLHNLCLHGIRPAPIFFAGGKRWPACACCSCSPCTSPAPPATPVRWLGLARTHRLLFCSEVHRDFTVGRNTSRKPASFSSGMKACTLK